MKINVLLVMPGKEPQKIKIPASMKFIRAFIGKDLYKIKLDENTVILGDKNANFTDFNRIFGTHIILGTFLIVSEKKNRLVSMKKKNIRKFTNTFKLRKHQKKIDIYKDEFLEEHYSNQRKIKQKNLIRNKQQLFNAAA